jgi:cation diffusion facilitator CzcD-associated flavoprotein CzcO
MMQTAETQATTATTTRKPTRAPTPVEGGVTVTAVERDGDGFRVATDRGGWRCAAVVVATGHCDLPLVPARPRRARAATPARSSTATGRACRWTGTTGTTGRA